MVAERQTLTLRSFAMRAAEGAGWPKTAHSIEEMNRPSKRVCLRSSLNTAPPTNPLKSCWRQVGDESRIITAVCRQNSRRGNRRLDSHIAQMRATFEEAAR